MRLTLNKVFEPTLLHFTYNVDSKCFLWSLFEFFFFFIMEHSDEWHLIKMSKNIAKETCRMTSAANLTIPQPDGGSAIGSSRLGADEWSESISKRTPQCRLCELSPRFRLGAAAFRRAPSIFRPTRPTPLCCYTNCSNWRCDPSSVHPFHFIPFQCIPFRFDYALEL